MASPSLLRLSAFRSRHFVIVLVSALAAAAVLVIAAWSSSAQEAHEFGLGEWNRTHPQPPAASAPPAAGITGKPQREAYGSGGAGRTVCVRTCDGYYFPLSATPDSTTEAGHMCRALCPAAATETYRMRGGADAPIADATNRHGKPYSALPAAFAYRKELKAGCSCQSAAAKPMSPADDPTLKAGDIVVTENGVRVLRGSGRAPHHARDFADYRHDRSLSRATAAYLAFVDRPFQARSKGEAASAYAYEPPRPSRRHRHRR
jgi:hypothetical protein